MAHAADLSFLVGELIKGTNKDLSVSEVGLHKRSVLNSFAHARSDRTSQFDVTARLEGIVEKSRILNNDPLADALQERLEELSTIFNKWTPEVLSLLLHLSDRPVHETRVEDLALLQSETLPAPLTWSDILADDPVDEQDDLWKNVDFTGGRSDEEDSIESDQSHNAERYPGCSPPDADALETSPEDLVEPKVDTRLREIEGAQFWKKKNGNNDGTPIQDPEFDKREVHQTDMLLTEAQAVREVIFMLLGLPTSLFTRNQEGGTTVSRNVGLRQVCRQSLTALLEAFVEIGNKLSRIRQWVARKAQVPLEQTFQASLASCLRDVDRNLSEIQARILDPDLNFIPSLLNLHDAISTSGRLIQKINEVLIGLADFWDVVLPFRVLEVLYESVCAHQRIGDTFGYAFMAKFFFTCFHTYLKPINLWMEMGELSGHDGVMFIERNDELFPRSSLWHDQYRLVNDAAGNLRAPGFLHVAARRIFNTGKSVNFLRHLNIEPQTLGADRKNQPRMTFENVYQPARLGSLCPFPELFDVALDGWIASKHHSSSSMLREQLETQCGLQRSLDALEYIYFYRNGALSENVAYVIFERIDRGHHRWNDDFFLTELFQGAHSTTSCIDVDQLDVRIRLATPPLESPGVRRSMSVLEDLRIIYTLPWSVANIIEFDSMETYQRIFVFLTQIHRAKYLLQRQKISKHSSSESPLLVYDIRHRLLWFINTMLTHLTQIALSATTATMRSDLKLADDVDAMMSVHKRYIAQLKHRCFLAKQQASILQGVKSVLDITILFSDTQASYASVVVSEAKIAPISRKANPKHAVLARENGKKGSESSNNSDESGLDGHTADLKSLLAVEPSNMEKLRNMRDTFSRLHAFVTAGVQGLSKADCDPCWEMLASCLAAGLVLR